MKDGKLCQVRGDRDGEGTAEPILIGTWKDPSNCSRPIGWQSVVGFFWGMFFSLRLQVGKGKEKWQATCTVVCMHLTWDTFSRSVKTCPFTHTNSWAIWDENLSKMENLPPCLFQPSKAVAYQGEGGRSGLHTIRGCVVCQEFKDSTTLSESTFDNHHEQAVLNSISEKSPPPSWDESCLASFLLGTPVQ